MKHRYPLVDGHGNVVQDLQNQTSKILARLFELQKFFWHRKEPEESDLAFLSSVRTEAFFVAWKQVFLGLPCDIFFFRRCLACTYSLLSHWIEVADWYGIFHGSEINMEVG